MIQVKVVVTVEDEDHSRHEVLLPQTLLTNDVSLVAVWIVSGCVCSVNSVRPVVDHVAWCLD